MLVGEERAVSELWEAIRRRHATSRSTTGPASRSSCSRRTAGGGRDRAATRRSRRSRRPRPRRARPPTARRSGSMPMPGTRRSSAGEREARSSSDGAGSGRREGRILFKAEASALDPERRSAPAGLGRPGASTRGHAKRGLADLCALLLERVPTVCLFARPENAAGPRPLRLDRDEADDHLSLADLRLGRMLVPRTPRRQARGVSSRVPRGAERVRADADERQHRGRARAMPRA